jgi:ribosomal peptide maturation radical SAM protein 1
VDGSGGCAAGVRRHHSPRCRRAHVEAFLDACLAEIVGARPRLVGFTSLFQQHTASLALARRVKDALPDTVIVFGGANCEGVMGAELVRRFPFVDAVVSGEGEIAFPELVARVLASQPLDGIAGVGTRRSIASAFAFGSFPNAPPVAALDDLPYPDFRDYLDRFGASRLSNRWLPTIPFETSRGCWWGAKHHCTFCGLNGETMAFRSKSGARALDELQTLAARFPGCEIQVVDTILDMQYFRTLLPELARRGPVARLFYETKSNLRKEQVRLLRDAGVTTIQPGIESFSDPVLARMRKGVTALQNVQLLKWCKELGVRPVWNVIWGFPGEPAESYAQMAALARRLTHLPAPDGYEGLRLDRFSPNFVESTALGFADVRPMEPYRYIYDLPDDAIRNLAYFHRFRYADGYDPAPLAAPLLRALGAWKRAARHSELFSMDVDGRLLIWDYRRRGRGRLVELGGIDRALYVACDQIVEFSALVTVGRAAGATSDADIRRRLDDMVALDLVIADGTRYLSLAVPVGEYQPPRHLAARAFRNLRYHREPA